MPTNNQLIRNPRKPKKTRRRKLALAKNWNSLRHSQYLSNNPQKFGVCKRVGKANPRKPNSAQRSFARVKLSNGEEVTVYIPGEGHNLQEFSNVLVQGRGAKDLTGVKYRVVRGHKHDAKGVEGRKQGRSLVGTKKVKPSVK